MRVGTASGRSVLETPMSCNIRDAPRRASAGDAPRSARTSWSVSRNSCEFLGNVQGLPENSTTAEVQ